MKVPYAYAHAWRVDSFCPLPFALCPLQTETEEAQDTTPKKRVEGGSQGVMACAKESWRQVIKGVVGPGAGH